MPILLGESHSFSAITFQSGLGFTGIAIALLGRNNPLGIAFAALLWAFLDQSALILDLNSIPKEIVQITQGVVVLSVVVAYEVVRRIGLRAQQRRVGRALAANPRTGRSAAMTHRCRDQASLLERRRGPRPAAPRGSRGRTVWFAVAWASSCCRSSGPSPTPT